MAARVLGRRSRHPVRTFSLRAMMLLMLAGLTGLIATNWRDVARYIRMRRM